MLKERHYLGWSTENEIKIKINKKNGNGRKTKDYIKTMLVDCKSWGGPCASVDELQLILRQNPGWNEKNYKNWNDILIMHS